jgi:uncharacterized protein
MAKMNKKQQIKATEEFVRLKIEGIESGHDWWHVKSVRKMAQYINERELIADPFCLEISALLHDVADSKFRAGTEAESYASIREFMNRAGLAEISDHVIEIISNVSFSNKELSGNPADPVLLVLQDADRLDAIGAIGIARAFNYGGFRNRAIYLDDDQDACQRHSTIAHFYDKLLKLKDLMNTNTARVIAEERHIFTENFLQQFYRDWDFAS